LPSVSTLRKRRPCASTRSGWPFFTSTTRLETAATRSCRYICRAFTYTVSCSWWRKRSHPEGNTARHTKITGRRTAFKRRGEETNGMEVCVCTACEGHLENSTLVPCGKAHGTRINVASLGLICLRPFTVCYGAATTAMEPVLVSSEVTSELSPPVVLSKV